MQLGFSLSFLLTALLFALTRVEASPVKRSPKIVTLPLKRVHHPADVPPSIFLQQHINRSHRRYARMTGIKGPSDAQLAKRLEKRLNLPRPPKHGKRYNRHGAHRVSTFSDVNVKITDPNTLVAHGDGGGNGNSSGVPDNQNTTGQGFPEGVLDANGLTNADTPAASNSLGLDIEARDASYIATIQIGNPPRDFSILMDSGSADFWVGSETCQTEGGGGCGPHTFLGSKSSTTFQDTGAPFNVTYGTGNVKGDIVTDDVNIAGLSLKKHTFGVANLESQDFSDSSVKFDGLMGLAQSTLSEQQVLTPVESLAQQGLISEATTSYKLARLSDGNNDGEITFGGLDPSKFDSKTLVTFQNVNKLGFWEGGFTVSVNGQDLGLQGRSAILDTGTTLLLAPPADAAALHAQIPGAKSDGQGGFTIPCTNTAVVSMTFSGQAFDIDLTDLLLAPVNQNDPTGDCVSAISASEIDGADTWLAGDVFLKNVYYSHNVGANEISLAKLV